MSAGGYKGRGLLSLVAAVVAVNLLPHWLVAPLNLFVTFLHETGHALAALLTGGEVSAIVIEPNGTGYTMTRGGSALVKIAGGYLGATFFGALFLRLNSIRSVRRHVLEGLAVFVLALTLYFGRSWFTIGYGVAAAGVLLFIGLATNDEVEFHTLTFLGVLVGMGALSDLRALIAIQQGARRVVAEGMGHSNTDAEAMAAATGIPALVWAFGWAALSAVILLREARRAAANR